MASVTKRHKRKYKGVKWIDTLYAIPYKRRRAFALCQCGVIAAVSMVSINHIKAARSLAGSFDRANKQAAIASVTINSMRAIHNTLSAIKR